MTTPSNSSSDNLPGSWIHPDGAANFNADNATIRRVLSMIGADTLVRVKAVHAIGLNPVGTVDVQIMVHQQDGAGRTTPHGTLYGLPYFRLQGGSRAIICDPAVGDIGAAIICGRDISGVKSTRDEAAPGSFRQYDYADGLYLGGYLNATPDTYVRLLQNAIAVGAPYTSTSGTLEVGAGATGAFTTPTGLTVTVRNGIITNIT